MGKISNNELATVLIDRNRLSKKNASRFVNELFNVIRQGLQNEHIVKVKGLGTFKIIDVDDRESVNVNTGERVLIEGHSKISFSPDALMKELVNKPFSQFETVVLNEGVDFEDVPEQEPEPEVEPESEVEPEPKVEPEPEVVSEPEPEIVVVSEPEISDEDDETDEVDASMAPLVDFVTDVPKEVEPPLPEIEAPSVDVEAPEKKIEPSEQKIEAPESEIEAPVSEEEPVEASSDEPQYLYEEESSGRWKMWLFGILACCLCFAGGYYFGSTYGGSSPAVEPKVETAKPKVETVKPKVEASKPEQGTPEQTKPETINPESQEPKAAEPKPESKPEAKPEVKLEPKPETKPVAQPEPEVALDKYEQMDSRIRTGAYRIVGTDHVEKVKATDNLARICKRTIGPGMECYLEVYNGIKGDADLKVGQEIKIPKLVHKKKKVKK